jgi:hypothetical protein
LELGEDRVVTATFAESGNEDPCEGVSCSGHGSCEDGTCNCDVGYAGDDCSDCADGYAPVGSLCLIEDSSGMWIGVPTPDWGQTIGNPLTFPKKSRPVEWDSDQEVAGYFFIDPTHPNAGSYTYGTPEHPRATMLSGTTWDPGTYIELGGGSFTGGQLIWTCNGTADNPVWIVGTDSLHRGSINYEFILKGSYIFIDGIAFNREGKGLGLRSHNLSQLHHVCIRNCEFIGTNTPVATSKSAIEIYGSSTHLFHDFVIYNNIIHDFGDYLPTAAENDYHGVKPSSYVDDVWIVENSIYHMGGDSVQVGEAQQDLAAYPNNIYIAGNDFYENHEDCIDIKKSNHVIVSQNNMHSLPEIGAIVVTHDAPTNVWVLFNECHDATVGIAFAGGNDQYAVGNVLYNINHYGSFNGDDAFQHGAGIHMRDGRGAAVGNTIYGCDFGIQLGSGGPWTVTNNIVSDLAETGGHHLIMSSAVSASNVVFDYNLIDTPSRIMWEDQITRTLISLQSTHSQGVNCHEADPGYVDAPDDLSLSAGSEAIDKGSLDAVYQLFSNTYGINIAVDFVGIARPLGSGWDMGAYEVQ